WWCRDHTKVFSDVLVGRRAPIGRSPCSHRPMERRQMRISWRLRTSMASNTVLAKLVMFSSSIPTFCMHPVATDRRGIGGSTALLEDSKMPEQTLKSDMSTDQNVSPAFINFTDYSLAKGPGPNLAYFLAKSGLADTVHPRALHFFEHGRHLSLLEAAKTCVAMLLPEAIDHTKTVGHARAWPKSPAWKKATTARPSQSSCLKVQEAGEMQAEFSERYLDGSAKSRLMPPPRCSAPRAPAICDYLLDLGGQITASLHVYSTGHLRADSYEPTGTYDTLQKNLGQDARMTLHQKAGLHETSLWRCGDCNFAAGSAHREPHSDSEAIRKLIRKLTLEKRVELRAAPKIDGSVSAMLGDRQDLYAVQRDGSILFFW
ncbi:Pol, partial [Symbiodinium microadriaticum]